MGGIDTLIMASSMKVVKMGAGPCSSFRTVTVTVSVIFVTVVLKVLRAMRGWLFAARFAPS